MKFYHKQFRKLRKEARWTIPQMEKVCGVSHATLSRWELGINSPSEANIRMLSNVLNIPINEISDYNKSDSLANEIRGKTETLHALSETNNLEFLKEKSNLIEGIEKLSNKLKTSSLIINALINTMDSAFYIKDAKNRYIIANNAFLDIVDIPKFSNIEGWTDSSFFPENEAKENTDEDKNILDKPGQEINRETHIPGTRKRRWGLITKASIRNKENRVEGMVCTIKDITGQKELDNLYKMVGCMIAESEICFSVIEAKTQKILYVNNKYSDLFGILPGINDYDKFWEYWLNKVVHPEDKEEQKKYLTTGKFPKNRVYRIIHPQRGIRDMNAYISNPIIFQGKKCKITITRDITQEINHTL